MNINFRLFTFKIIIINILLIQSLLPNNQNPELVAQLMELAKSPQISEYTVQSLLEKSGYFSFTSHEITQVTRLLQNQNLDLLNENLENFLIVSKEMNLNRDRSHISISTPHNRPLSGNEQAIINQIVEDFQVNEKEGEGFQYQPAVAMDPNGNFIAVWQDFRDGQSDIYAQIFNSTGGRTGANFKVNDDSKAGGARQAYPAISLDSHGNFVIVWQDERNGQNDFDIYGQRYSNSGKPIGTNFLVSNDMTGSVQYMPAIVVNLLGDFIVVWTDQRNGNNDIYAQRFNADATKIGGNFMINDDASKNHQYAPVISMDANGNFVVVWYDMRNGNYDIFGQRYSSNGNKQGVNFKISNDTTNKSQTNPSVAMNSTGDFLVAWTDNRDGNNDIYAQRFSSSGISDANNFKINDDNGTTSQSEPSVSIGGSGNYIVVWQDERAGAHLYGQRFNSNGTKLGSNFPVRDTSTSNSQDPCVAQDNGGNFVVIWQDLRNGHSDIYGQRYRSSGVYVGVNFTINDDKGSSRQLYPSIAVNEAGSFVIVWEDYRNGNADVYGQRYNKSGIAQGGNFKINSDTGTGSQRFPSVAIDKNGNFVVVWDDYRDGNFNIYGQRFYANGILIGVNFKINDDTGTTNQLVPSISMDANGNFTVVWQDNRLGNSDIYAQQYTNSGLKQGANFKINDGAGTSEEKYANISMNASGNFIVVWSDGRNGTIDTYFQRYSANGSKQGSNTKANDNIGSYYNIPAVAIDASGNFIVTWVGWINNSHADICLQRYDNSGTKLGNNFVANDDNSNMNQINPSIAADSDGNFVVNWEDYRTSWQEPDIYTQIYSSSGAPVGGNVRVNQDSGEYLQGFPRVDFVNNQIYHTWVDGRMAGQGYDIFARIIDLVNSAPDAPTLTSPANNSYTLDNTPTLNFSIPKDNENDKLNFKVEIATSNDFSNQISGSPFESEINTTGFSPEPPVTPGTGMMSYTIQTTLPDASYYWRVSAKDNDTYGQTSSIFNFKIDTTPPNTSSLNPAINATDVPINTSISFHLLDGGSGVEKTSIKLKVNNLTVTPVISGSASDYTINYSPAQSFNYGQTISVIIDAMDVIGNKMTTISYSFTTVSQSNTAPDAPTLTEPSDAVFLNNSKPELSWSVPADQNLDLLHFKVELDNDHNWNQIFRTIESKTDMTGFSPTPPVAQGSGSMRYMVQTALTEGDWWWRVTAWDSKVYGNYSVERKFTIDLTPPFTENHQPAKGAKDIAVNTDISLEIKDLLSGIDNSKIEMTLNGSAVTPTFANITSGVRVSYNPPQDFGNNQIITITVKANDIAGNAMTLESYSFTTVAQANTAPQAPLLTAPASEDLLNNPKPQLSWSVPQDANLDALHFKIELDNDHNWDNISQIIESKTNTQGFSPTPPVTQGTGSVVYSVQSNLSEGIWWWRVAAWDGKVYGNYSTERKFTIDLTAPFTSNHQPSKGSQGVAIDTDISLEINDLLSGIDNSKIELAVNGVKVNPTFSAINSGAKVSYKPPQNFGYEQTVSVSVKAEDKAGNEMPVENYTFITASQTNTAPAAPTLTSPAKDIYINNQKPVLAWSIPQDINADALHFKIELDDDHNWNPIYQIIESKTSTQGFSPTPPVAQNSGSINYTFQANLNEGDWWWRIAAWDGKLYGSYSDESHFSIDITPPATAGHSPTKNATNVPVNAHIRVSVQDSRSGVDSTKIVMKVNQLAVTPQISGSSSNYSLTYIPKTNWEFQSTVNVTIEAIDRAGNKMPVDNYSFTTESIMSTFTINHTPQSTADSGAVTLIKADFASNITLSSVKLFYRQGGEAKYDSLTMTEESPNFYLAILPSNKMRERGIEYYISALDNLGRKATTPAGAPKSKPNMIQVKVNNLPCPNTTPSGIYRLFSIPLVLNLGRIGDVLMDDLSDYDKTQWRLFRYQGMKYVEFSEGKLEDFAPGRCFWLITREAKKLDIGGGTSTPTNANFILDLQPGWNMIGNPFAFPVKWDQVIKNGNVEAPVTYKGQDNQPQGFEYNQTTLGPWQGYVVRNLESSVTRIEIPPTEATVSMAKTTILAQSLESDEWFIQLIVTSGNLNDRDNYLGHLDSAVDEWDPNDFSEVPPFDRFISLYFPHSQWIVYPGNYTGDFRKINKKGGEWKFNIESNLDKSPVKLELGQIHNVPANWEIKLVDEISHTPINLKTQRNYSFTANLRAFSIQVGPSIDVELEDIPAMTNFTLFQNYPNPFNPATQIRYWLAQSGFVKLEIYNLAGQQIIILQEANEEAGMKLIEWDGLLPSGEKAPSGIYWCRLTVNQLTQTRKMVLAR